MIDIRVRISEDVPRDEVWFVEPPRWEVFLPPSGIAVGQRFKILGKIVNLGDAT